MDHVTLELHGHLGRAALEPELVRATRALARARRPVLVDCRGMSGYDTDARDLFVTWSRGQRDHVAALAIVTENRLWWMVISAMALASGQSMRAFASHADAIAWLSTRP